MNFQGRFVARLKAFSKEQDSRSEQHRKQRHHFVQYEHGHKYEEGNVGHTKGKCVERVLYVTETFQIKDENIRRENTHEGEASENVQDFQTFTSVNRRVITGHSTLRVIAGNRSRYH